MSVIEITSQGSLMTPAERFDQIYRTHAGAVLRYARYRVGADQAEDLVAETFALAWRKLDQVPPAPRPWLLAAARRISANLLRARRTRLAHQAGLEQLARDVPDGAADVERRRDLMVALRALPEADREAVLLVTWHDLTHAEAAEVIGCSTSAFGVRLHRARKRLARILAPAPTSTSTTPHHQEHLR